MYHTASNPITADRMCGQATERCTLQAAPPTVAPPPLGHQPCWVILDVFIGPQALQFPTQGQIDEIPVHSSHGFAETGNSRQLLPGQRVV